MTTNLPVLGKTFALKQSANGYAMRGVDFTSLYHNVLQVYFGCIDKGVTCTDLSSSIGDWYPFIGTTATSQKLNLNDVTADALVSNGSPTVADGYTTFNGSTQWLAATMNTATMPSGTGAGSMSIFFKFSSNTGCEMYGIGNNAGAGKRVGFYYTGANLEAEISGAGRYFAWTYDTNWHHLVVTWPASAVNTQIVMYYDGSSQTLTNDGTGVSINIATTSSELAIGRLPTYGGGLQFPGSLGNAMCWRRQITSGEVTQIWNSQKGKFGL